MTAANGATVTSSRFGDGSQLNDTAAPHCVVGLAPLLIAMEELLEGSARLKLRSKLTPRYESTPTMMPP
jgi:hypothetical protein